jgi:F-type H+-transporting ATPase subunit b
LNSRDKKYLLVISLTLGVATYQFLCIPYAFAAGELSPGRRLWDNIMLWVNFGILTFFFLRYAKKPLMDYLRGVRKKIEEELNIINRRLEDAKSTKDAEAEKLQTIGQQIEEIQRSITEIGKREKEKIIEQGRITAEKMIQNAKAYSKYKMAMTKKALSDEMVDIAITMVEERLIKGISEEDNERLVKQFVMELETTRPHTNQDL